jgi:hypothetical protein
MNDQPARLMQNGLTGRWYAITKYSFDDEGRKVAKEKHDVTDDVAQLQSQVLFEFASELENRVRKTQELVGALTAGDVMDMAQRLALEKAPEPSEGKN